MATKIFTSAWQALASRQERMNYLDRELSGLTPYLVYIDDSEEALEIFSDMAEDLGLRTFVSRDPEEVLEFIRSHRASVLVVFSDYQMSPLTGFQFREKVMGVASEIPFVILSGYVDRDMALKGLELKIAAFLDKPVRENDLIEVLCREGDGRAHSLKEEFELIRGFTSEAEGIIEQIEEICLDLDMNPNDIESISRLFGLVHTIKGASGFFDPRTLHQFAHVFEEYIKEVQNTTVALTSGMVTSWLNAIDVLKMLVGEFATGEHKNHQVSELVKIFKASGDVSQDGTREDASGDEKRGDSAKGKKTEDIKVSMALLDEFMQISGEMTVIRNMINKAVKGLEKRFGADKDVTMLGELLEEMHKINTAVQGKITEVRRVSVRNVLRPISRTVRDTAKALGKEVDFVVVGEHMRIDNSIADVLSRCLIHLVRNSIDHGLEMPHERHSFGKSRKGKLEVKVAQQGDFIIVKLSDDGRGLNLDRIRAKTVEQGLRSPADAAKMSVKELSMMIFEAGFSTALQATEFSGRGVGMSMVKDSVEEIGGVISIDTVSGQGTMMTLKLPVPKSVLISNCLFVEAKGMLYGIPREHIVRVVEVEQLRQENLMALEGAFVVKVNGDLVPLQSLGDVLEHSSEEQSEENYKGFVVILKSDKVSYALRVDKVLDIEDSVIKSLDVGSIKRLGIYLGGTFLSDGSVGLILNIDGFAQHCGMSTENAATRAGEESKKQQEDTVDAQTPSVSRYVTCELKQSGVFALSEMSIYRIEEVSRESLQTSGPWHVMPYRDSLMTLVNLDSVLDGQAPNERNLDDLPNPIPTLVVKHQDRYFGLGIYRLVDLEFGEPQASQVIENRLGVSQYVVLNGRTLTVLNLEQIFNHLVGHISHEENPHGEKNGKSDWDQVA